MNEDLLKKLFINDLFTVSQEKGKHFVRLKERGEKAKLRQVDIYGVENNSVVLDIDKYQNQNLIFKGQLGENKRCDYLLFTELDKQKIILFIELKSRKIKKKMK